MTSLTIEDLDLLARAVSERKARLCEADARIRSKDLIQRHCRLERTIQTLREEAMQ